MIDYNVPKAVRDWLDPNAGKPSFEIVFCGDGMKTREEFLATTKAIREWCAENKFTFSSNHREVVKSDTFMFERKEIRNHGHLKCVMKFEKQLEIMRLREKPMSTRLSNILCNYNIYTNSDAAHALIFWLHYKDRPRNLGDRTVKELCSLMGIKIRVIPAKQFFLPKQFVLELL